MMGKSMNGRRRPFSTLQRYVQRDRRPAVDLQEACESCSESIPSEHRHVLEVAAQQIIRVCRACAILFDAEEASGGKYRLIPDRYLVLVDFQITEAQWQGLHIPVGLAFCFYSTPAQRAVAFYPSPMGATEALLELCTWTALCQRNAVLTTLRRDVEALLIHRVRGAREYFVVPIDQCYRLVGLIRLHWRGLSGGQEGWKAIAEFFETLRQHTRTMRQADCSSPPPGSTM